jgi:hypothetical protein
VYGVAVGFKDPTRFKETYLELVSNLKAKYGLRTNLYVLKSYKVLSTIGRAEGYKFLEEIFDSLRSEL